MNWLLDILGADQYRAHQECLSNDPIVMTLFTGFDGATMVAYLFLGTMILVFAPKIARVSTTSLRLYGAFFLFCAVHRALAVVTLFLGVYRLEIVVNAVMLGALIGIVGFSAGRLRESFQPPEGR